MEGSVRLADGGLPSQRIEIKLELHGMLVDRVFTDGRGRFTFSGLGANTYTLVVDDTEFEPINQSVSIMTVSGGPVAATLTLRRRGSGTDPMAGLSPGARKEFEAGMQATDKGDTEEAIEHYRKVLEKEPEFYPAHNNLGWAYMRQQKLPEAEQAFQEALLYTQTDAGPCFGLGNVHLMSGKLDQAEAILLEGLERDSKSAFGRYLLGTVYFQTQRSAEAEENLRAALEFDPKLALAQMTLVNLYLQQQRDREALAQLNLFVERFPEHSMISQAKQLKKQLEDWLQSQSNP